MSALKLASLVVVLSLLVSSYAKELTHLSVGIMHKPDNCPRESKEGDQLTVRFNNTFIDQTLLQPMGEFQFTLGEGQVIAGWDYGLKDMCVGELRELIVPPHYGYGEMSAGDLFPPKALLVFYVELLKISDLDEDSGKPNMFKEIDVDGDGMISHREVAGYLRREALSNGEGEESHENLLNEIFQEEDKNRDGFISHDEFQGIKHGGEL